MILVLGAMDSEISSFADACTDRTECSHAFFTYTRGILMGKSVAIARSGVGKTYSAACTQALIDLLKPRALIFMGLAGSLRPDIHIGDTIVATDCVQHDMESGSLGFPRGHIPFSEYRFIPCDPALVAAASSYLPERGMVHLGRICTGDQFIDHTQVNTRSYLVDELDGHAVEMEGASVGLVATINKVPFVLIRTISDMADGSARVNFQDFLPVASLNSLAALKHLCSRL